MKHDDCSGILDTSKSTGDWALCDKCGKKVYGLDLVPRDVIEIFMEKNNDYYG